MARTPPLPGYTRPREFGVWPRSTIPLPQRIQATGSQCDRFMESLQRAIARHMFDTDGIYIYSIGWFWRAPNRPTTIDDPVRQVGSTYRNPVTREFAAQRQAWVIRYAMSSSLRKHSDL